jgi:hypothetical protein
MNENNIIIYNTADGKASVSLLAKNGTAWMSQARITADKKKKELFYV